MLNNQIKKIRALIDGDIKKYEEQYYINLNSPIKLINTIIKYFSKRKGKQIRPLLTLLSARICGDPSTSTYDSAALIEILHIATLIHDDIVDGSPLRRGIPTINRIWKNKISLLIGDYMFSQVLQSIIAINNNEALKILSKTSKRLTQGEILQIEKSISKNMNEEIYFKMISDKTASLISASCKLGALSVTDDRNKINKLGDFGEKLGIAFQIKDDLFDILGNIDGLGKPTGYDIKKNMLTLPLIHILEKMNNYEKNNFKIKLKFGNQKENVKIIESLGGIEYAKRYIDNISNQAINLLDIFPSSDYKNALISLIDFNINRKN